MNEQENVCGICHESLSAGKTKVIHKNKMWRHEFHKVCIDQWIKVCEKSNNPPCCPICVNFIIPKKMTKTLKLKAEPQLLAPVIQEPAQAEFDRAANERWQRIANSENPLFMGIMICSRRGRTRVPVVKFLQSDLGIESTWTLHRIKEHIKTMNREVYWQKGFFDSDNVEHNVRPFNWFKWKYPTLRITDTYYGTPSQGGRLFEVHHQLDDNKTAREMYIECQSMMGFCIKHRFHYSDEAVHKIQEVYYEKVIREYDYSMPELILINEERFFNNESNPIIPAEHREYRKHPRSTKHSLAWLVLDIEYE